MAVVHTSKIEFTVELDENKIPENISWTAEDGGIDNHLCRVSRCGGISGEPTLSVVGGGGVSYVGNGVDASEVYTTGRCSRVSGWLGSGRG